MSSPTTGGHAGWGKPGTEWDGVHFRTFILGTVPTMREYERERQRGRDFPLPLSLIHITASAAASQGEDKLGKAGYRS